MAKSSADVKIERFLESPLGANLLKYRRFIIVSSQLILVGIAYYASFLLRFDFELSGYYKGVFAKSLPFLILIKAIVFFLLDLYRGWWRYVGMDDLMDILKACAVSGLLFFPVAYVAFGSTFPRSIFVLDFALCFLFVGGIRFLIRAFREYARILPKGPSTNALIYGSREIGVELLKEIKATPQTRIDVIGFIDDFAPKKGFKIHGVPILGGQEEIPEILTRYSVDEIIITTPSLKAKELKALINRFQEANVRFKIVPPMADILTDKVSVRHLRDVQVEDLLGRESIQLDTDRICAGISDRVVMITGAGGSIGSELARQVAAFQPAELILFERNENNLFLIQWELERNFPELHLCTVIGDILDNTILERVMSQHKPDVVYHAAAYKHVPMMETHPLEAIRNNVMGTRNVAEMAVKHKVSQFVLISTDKAVRPTNVMGMTKRVAEKLATCFQKAKGKTRFISVRFGNVMGSTGSVIPLFTRQINEGGPVTVTHPDAMRYFMTIPEAVQLVMQAAAMGDGGEIFILEMGEQIRILDLARNLIRLSGLEPERDIEIVFTGLRPGEKLSEELWDNDEGVGKTAHEKIKLVRGNGKVNRAAVTRQVERMLGAVDEALVDQALLLLRELSDAEVDGAAARTVTK
jgi:FlaA1/EpsC-like NDP-sugar epimerase